MTNSALSEHGNDRDSGKEQYQCNNDELCGESFRQPEESPEGWDVCPECGTTDIEEVDDA